MAITFTAQDLLASVHLKYLLNSFCKGLFKGSELLLHYLVPLLFIESVIQQSLHCDFFLLFGVHMKNEKEKKLPNSLNDLCA